MTVSECVAQRVEALHGPVKSDTLRLAVHLSPCACRPELAEATVARLGAAVFIGHSDHTVSHMLVAHFPSPTPCGTSYARPNSRPRRPIHEQRDVVMSVLGALSGVLVRLSEGRSDVVALAPGAVPFVVQCCYIKGESNKKVSAS